MNGPQATPISSAPEAPELSFARLDWEERLACPSGRFTSPGPVLAPLGGAALTVGLYAALAQLPGHPLAAMFTERGPTPYAMVFVTAWSLVFLLLKQRKVALQRRALTTRLTPPGDPFLALTPETAERLLEAVYRAVDDPEAFFLTRRIHHALCNLKNMRRIGDVDEALRTQADYDEGQVEASYTLLRGFTWALPVFGFIGTVLGLSQALGSFGGVLEHADDIGQLRQALQQVTGGLATAFETTLLGLLATVLVHLLMIVVRGQEERLLEDCQAYCQRNLVHRLRLSGEPEGVTV